MCFNAAMDELTAAIKQLRAHLGESQQVFANRLGITSRAVANYEAGRTPTRRVLWELMMLAGRTNNPDIENLFVEAYNATMQNLTKPANDEEEAWVRMVLTMLRNKNYVPALNELGHSLLAAAEGLMSASKQGNTLTTDNEELEEAVSWVRSQITPSAEQQLRRLASDRRSRTGETFATAYAQVLIDNPELYQKYQKELAGRPPFIAGHPVESMDVPAADAAAPDPRKRASAKTRKSKRAKS
jgi:transcriptional regulator with XRE-family HTH domain